jgi:hypothetical protein
MIEFFFDGSDLPAFEFGTLMGRQRPAARMSAPNISFRAARSPNAFGMI